MTRTPWVLRADLGDAVHAGAHDLAAVGDEHDLVVGSSTASEPTTGPLRSLDLDGDDALAAAVLDLVLLERRALAVALGAHRQDRAFGLGGQDRHADDVVARAQVHAAHAAGGAAHRAHVALLEADRHAPGEVSMMSWPLVRRASISWSSSSMVAAMMPVERMFENSSSLVRLM
jgi:hypothetical protein